MREPDNEGPLLWLNQRAELYKGYGVGGLGRNTYPIRCSADVVRVEAALEILDQPDGRPGEAAAAAGTGLVG